MARKKAYVRGGHNNSERWLLTYADLITLLMVFFVVMFAMSRSDSVKLSRLSASLQRAFNIEVLEGFVPTAVNGEFGAEGSDTVIDTLSLPPQVSEDLQQIRQDLAEAFLALRQRQGRQGTGGHEAGKTGDGSSGSDAFSEQNVQIGLSHEGIVVSFSGSLLFDSGRAEIKPQAAGLLATLGEELAKLPNPLRVEGHTDNVPINSPLYPTNWELSVARSVAVSRYLSEQLGVKPDRIAAAGYGEYRPVASNDTREGRARNRRVDIVILYQSAAAVPSDGRPVPSRGVAPITLNPPIGPPVGPRPATTQPVSSTERRPSSNPATLER